MQQKVDLIFQDISKDISDKINKEFEREEIRSLVEAKARERIDLIADKLIEDAIQSKINPQILSSE